MSGITKCHGDGCDRKESCYRYTYPAGFNQSWNSPNAPGEKCMFFWPIPVKQNAKRRAGAGW